jgi:chorismate mutase/prephenate dehydratase
MSETGVNNAQMLADLRGRIDAVDAQMHRLLVERSAVIDALIDVKGTSRTGAAFRPGREADMMRRLVARHEGALPLAAIEHIWREIITTFTCMQAPFGVAIDSSTDPERMRDLARFYFGFSVDLVSKSDAASVVAHVAATGDLGVVARNQKPGVGAWWRDLEKRSAPQIMSLLPFINIAERQADLPAFVISLGLADPTPAEIRVLSISVNGDFTAPGSCSVLANVNEAGRDEVLLAAPASESVTEIAAAAGGKIDSVVEVGGVSRGIAVDGAQSLLYQKLD